MHRLYFYDIKLLENKNDIMNMRCLFLCFIDMEVSKAYTVVPPSILKEKQDERVLQGKVLYLMIKIYPDGVLTPYIGNLKIGKLCVRICVPFYVFYI